MNKVALQAFREIFGSYAAVVFVAHPAAGVLVCAASFVHPSAGAAGLLGAIIGWGTARLSGLSPHLFRLCACNALLVGLSLGAIFVASQKVVVRLTGCVAG